ncbi:hypothetical protein VTL71DRAFT_9715 [Oculimacula yallundae]|uniref:Uncharacterized protein n=1 Tax=Oculimacula yallundae TaxID=86028 RepID=A0ABR4BRP5_9HELO
MPPMNAQAQVFRRTQTNIDATEQVLAKLFAMTLENPQTSALVIQPTLNQKNIVGEFARYFGSENKLENWQRLCRDVGIDRTLTSLNQCKKELQKVWVNIFDLIAAVHQNKIPRLFPNVSELRKYTIKSKKIFPKRKAKEGGPVRALLAHIF